MLPEITRSMARNALVLGLFAVVTVGAVTLLRQATAERIEAAGRAAQVRALGQLLPPGSYDNDLLAYSRLLQDPLLGGRTAQPAYLALHEGRPAAVILRATAPDGYSGAIHLLVGIRADGRIAGVRVLEHRETPGLGDKIEAGKSDWIHGFAGRSLASPAAEGWAVKKDGGRFDQFAGATITPRAVVGAVHRTLQYFDANRQVLLDPAAYGAGTDTGSVATERPEATRHTRAGDEATRDDLRAGQPSEDEPR
ncbi:electron transport complex subunit RsxG [Stutzerimonas azotifigens]|uniref:electron transport complex subunit RsxG n=1 Tax=Stutzerimonas azotifigens TaxID=291995 RepID=UPI0003F65E99|nr:electron transport complex subunit RsxG [Stutzerimonas azotifigens]